MHYITGGFVLQKCKAAYMLYLARKNIRGSNATLHLSKHGCFMQILSSDYEIPQNKNNSKGLENLKQILFVLSRNFWPATPLLSYLQASFNWAILADIYFFHRDIYFSAVFPCA